MNFDGEIVFVAGAHKTGTSVLAEILNCSSSIFMFIEGNFFKMPTGRTEKKIYKRIDIFCKKFPETRVILEKKNGEVCYKKVMNILNKRYNQKYKIVGDKYPGIDYEYLDNIKGYKTFFMLRDAKTWIAKSHIQIAYNSYKDAVTPLINYLRFFLTAKSILRKAMFIKMEQIISTDRILSDVALFLNANKEDFSEWREKIKNGPRLLLSRNPKDRNRGQGFVNDPKAYWRFGGHASTLAPKGMVDVNVELKNNEFWDKYDSIFSKHYNDPNKKIDQAEIDCDLRSVECLLKYSPQPLSDLMNCTYKKIK